MKKLIKEILEELEGWRMEFVSKDGRITRMMDCEQTSKLLEEKLNLVVEEAKREERKEILDIVQYHREKSMEGYKEYRVISPNSYGAGVEWGVVSGCDDILNDISEL